MKTTEIKQKKSHVTIHALDKKHAKELKRKAKAKARRKYVQKSKSNNTKSNKKYKREKIILPEVFDLHNNHERVMEKINTYREYFDDFSTKRNVRIDYSKIEKITLSSALVLAADIDAWRITKRPCSISLPKKIIELFDDLGFFELLEIHRDSNSNTQEKDISRVRFLSAQKADGEKAATLREGIEKTMGLTLASKQRHALYNSLTEALTNAKQHAYTNPTDLKDYEKWWITAACGPDKELTVVIYDRGMTIPATMAKTWISDRMSKVVNNDAKFISVAMEASYSGKRHRSQTKEKHRGKGLAQLLDMVRLENGGKVHIISGRGYCCFSVKNDKLVINFEKNLKFPIHGTLIEWQIRL